MSKLKKIGIILFSLIVVVTLYYYIYPEVSTYIPHSMKVKSKSYSIESVYYLMNMEQITDLKIDSTEVVLTGYNLSFFKPQPKFKILRDIPEKYLPLNNLDTTWNLAVIGQLEEGFEVRTFVNKEDNDSLVVWLPFMGGRPIYYVYNLANNNKLFILSGGNWKRSDKVYLSYILLKKLNAP
jgi:hypothetical protein